MMLRVLFFRREDKLYYLFLNFPHVFQSEINKQLPFLSSLIFVLVNFSIILRNIDNLINFLVLCDETKSDSLYN